MHPEGHIFPIVDKLLLMHSKKLQLITPNHSGTYRHLFSCAAFVINHRRFVDLSSGLCKAFAAKNSSVITGLEGNLCLAATLAASSYKEFSFAFSSLLTCNTAILAALGFVYETFFCEEFLFACGEYKFITAFFACESLVFVHFATSL